MRKELRFNRFRILAERLLLLLLAPAGVTLAISITLSFATGRPAGSYIWYVLAAIILLAAIAYALAYTSFFEEYLHAWQQRRRAQRFQRPRVLVLDGRIENDSGSPPQLIYTDRTPQQWLQSLQGDHPSWKVRTGPVCCIWESSNIDIVINPFGEVYPEEEPGLYSTFSAVRRYVFAGGVWVNVAGYPFYYQHNPATNSSHLAGRAGQGREEQPGRWTYDWVPLIRDALPFIVPDMGHGVVPCIVKQSPSEIQQFGDIVGKGVPSRADMFRAYPVGTRQMQSLLRTDGDQWIVIGSVKYGDGFFLLVGLEIKGPNGGFEKALAAVGGWAAYETHAK
jgi:hypothetical protein